jgi:hypothetical protein
MIKLLASEAYGSRGVFGKRHRVPLNHTLQAMALRKAAEPNR